MTEQEGRRRDRTEAIGKGIGTLAIWSLRVIAIAAGLLVVGYLLGRLWIILLPVLLALTLSTALWPPTAWLRERGWPPALAAISIVLGALLLLAGVVTLITPSVVNQATDIADAAADGLVQIQEWVTGPPLNLSETQIDSAVDAITDRLQSSASVIATGVITGVTAVGNALVNLVIILFLAFFFLKDGPRFLPWLRDTVGEQAGAHLDAVARRAWRTLGGFVRGQAAVGLIDAIFIGVGLLILGVPLALPLAVLTFLGGFVPIVGAFVAGALAILVALVTQGPTSALIVLIIVLAVQQIEGNLLQPLLQSRTLRLHQAVILLAVAAGASLYGVAGAFFAVPVVAVFAEILRYLGELLDRKPGQAQPRGPEEPEDNEGEPEPDADPPPEEGAEARTDPPPDGGATASTGRKR